MKKMSIFILVISFLIVTAEAGIHPSYARGELVAQSLSPTQQMVNSVFDNKAANFRLALNSLLKEHTIMGGATLTALYEGKDTTRLEQLLQANEDELADAVFTVYGDNTRTAFMRLWSQHMQEYKNYTLAKKQNNTTAMNAAKNNLQVIANNMGTLFDRAGNNVSATTVTQLMMEHINGTLSLVDAVADQNETTKANLMEQGYDQAGKFADVLAKGMILDKPNLFK